MCLCKLVLNCQNNAELLKYTPNFGRMNSDSFLSFNLPSVALLLSSAMPSPDLGLISLFLPACQITGSSS